MQERYAFPDTAPLPQPAELAGLLRQYREVGFRYTDLPDNYLDALSEVLENHTFKHWPAAAGGTIILTPAISTASILARKEALHNCARVFRQQAFHLVQLLHEALAVPPSKRQDWRELMQLKMRQPSGQVNSDWHYHLHGSECRFEHARTGQVVEVIIANLPECGCLDACFFLMYINTTEQFADLRQWLGNEYENAEKALAILARRGVLPQLASAWDNRNLLAY